MFTPDFKSRLVLSGYALLALLIAASGPVLFIGGGVMYHWYFSWWQQLAAGAAVVLTAACLCGPLALHQVRQGSPMAPLGLVVAIFLFGAVTACTSNVALAGEGVSGDTLNAYWIKPMFWLVLFGVPCAALFTWPLRVSFERIGASETKNQHFMPEGSSS